MTKLKLPLELPLKQGLLVYLSRLKVLAYIGLANLEIILVFSILAEVSFIKFLALILVSQILIPALIKVFGGSSELSKVISQQVALISLIALVSMTLIGFDNINAYLSPERFDNPQYFGHNGIHNNNEIPGDNNTSNEIYSDNNTAGDNNISDGNGIFYELTRPSVPEPLGLGFAAILVVVVSYSLSSLLRK